MRLSSVIVLCLCLMLNACGYRPLYGGGSTAAVTVGLSQVAVAEQKTRAGQLLRNELLSSRVGASSDSAAFVLEMTVIEKGEARPGTRERVIYRLSVDYRLADSRTGKVVNEGKSYSVVPFDTVKVPLADLQAENNARERAARELGQDLKIRLAAFFVEPNR